MKGHAKQKMDEKSVVWEKTKRPVCRLIICKIFLNLTNRNSNPLTKRSCKKLIMNFYLIINTKEKTLQNWKILSGQSKHQ
jgi:hypothetical protein